MENRELRIGSIGIYHKQYAKVLEIREDALKLLLDDDIIIEDPQGLEFASAAITEDVLIRLGFDKDEDGVWELPSVMWSCEIGYGGSMTFKKLGFYILCPDILYVHQLQNVFWSLEEETMDGEGSFLQFKK